MFITGIWISPQYRIFWAAAWNIQFMMWFYIYRERVCLATLCFVWFVVESVGILLVVCSLKNSICFSLLDISWKFNFCLNVLEMFSWKILFLIFKLKLWLMKFWVGWWKEWIYNIPLELGNDCLFYSDDDVFWWIRKFCYMSVCLHFWYKLVSIWNFQEIPIRNFLLWKLDTAGCNS